MIWYLWMSMQIILEMFPISSSAHVFLLEKIVERIQGVRIWLPVTFQAQSEMLLDIIHLPTLVVIIFYFFNRWFIFLRYFYQCWPLIIRLIFLVGITDTMTCTLYLVIRHYHIITIPLWLGLSITALLLWSLRWCPSGRRSWNARDAFLLGCVQGLALLPGISRYGSTFVIARWLGISERHATEISFLIEMPLVAAAFLFALIFNHNAIIWTQLLSLPSLLVILVSSVVSWYVLRCSLYLSSTQKLHYVGWYMLIPLIGALSL